MLWDGRRPLELARSWDVPFVEAYASIGSTNDRAIELAAEGAPAWTVVVADEQIAGRGRRGSGWISASGSGLWMSVLLRDRDSIPVLPLLVGLACAEAIESVQDVRVGIKWPNDLFIGSRKVGGILCEAADSTVVAGVGINVSALPEGFPSDIAAIATSLDAGGSEPPSRSALARAVLSRLRVILDKEDPYAAAHGAIRDRDALSARDVRTDQAGMGRAMGIDEGGALLMERPDGSRVRIISGSVGFADADS
jgi:BirA family biotin operon repressor/biotin-[acetyl-CoA-carboxylase] ligase